MNAYEYFQSNYNDMRISLSTIKFYYRKLMGKIVYYIKEEMESIFFNEEVEIDESLIYKKKNNNDPGRPRKNHIWIFGIKGRKTNKFVLYVVKERKREVLLEKIMKHVAHGSTIY